MGDSLAGGIIYPIAVSVGCALALKGNFTGPILFFAVFTGIMLVLGYNLYQMGYKQGSRSVMNILGEGAGSITRMTDAFGILGLLVIGAMGAEKVLVYVPLQISIGQTTVIFQDVLNGLLPNLLPFGFIIGTWGLLKKKVSPIVVVLILMVIGIVGYYTGILGLGV